MDAGLRADPTRAEQLRTSVASETALVAIVSGALVGYTVLDHSFFGNAFLVLLVVRADSRRKGFGTALLRAAEARAQTAKVFASTNQSNPPMQRLLESAGYQRSGVIENLDAGDPELIYVHFLGADAA